MPYYDIRLLNKYSRMPATTGSASRNTKNGTDNVSNWRVIPKPMGGWSNITQMQSSDTTNGLTTDCDAD